MTKSKFRLKVNSFLHISSGDQLDSFEYYLGNKWNTLVVMDVPAVIFDIIRKFKEIDVDQITAQLKERINGNQYKNITFTQFIKKLNDNLNITYDFDEYSRFIKNYFKIDKLEEVFKKNYLQKKIRNIELPIYNTDFYVPGSSIKGSLIGSIITYLFTSVDDLKKSFPKLEKEKKPEKNILFNDLILEEIAHFFEKNRIYYNEIKKLKEKKNYRFLPHLLGSKIKVSDFYFFKKKLTLTVFERVPISRHSRQTFSPAYLLGFGPDSEAQGEIHIDKELFSFLENLTNEKEPLLHILKKSFLIFREIATGLISVSSLNYEEKEEIKRVFMKSNLVLGKYTTYMAKSPYELIKRKIYSQNLRINLKTIPTVYVDNKRYLSGLCTLEADKDE